ncbi:MAG: prolipoprotein diacylglyceryl transferase family protein [Sandaracinus sp.]
MSGLIPWFRLEAIPIPLPEHLELFGFRASFPQDWSIQPFGLLVATGVMLGASLAERRAKAVGVHPNAVASCVAHVLIGGFVIGHVFDALAYHPDVVREDPLFLLKVWDGLSSFGGFLGAVLGLMLYLQRFGADARVVGDPIAWAFPLGWMFGRTGCFVVHDHPGAPTDFFLGVRDYQVGPPPYVTRHDMGLYEILWSAAVMGLFVYLAKTPRKRGFYLGLLPILYAPIRFGLDFLRATDLEYGDARYFGLTPGHYSAIVLLAAGVLFLRWVQSSPEPEVPESIRYVPEDEERARAEAARKVEAAELADEAAKSAPSAEADAPLPEVATGEAKPAETKSSDARPKGKKKR